MLAFSSLVGFDLVGFDLGSHSTFSSQGFENFECFGEGDVTEVGSLSAASDIGSSSLHHFCCLLAEVVGELGVWGAALLVAEAEGGETAGGENWATVEGVATITWEVGAWPATGTWATVVGPAGTMASGGPWATVLGLGRGMVPGWQWGREAWSWAREMLSTWEMAVVDLETLEPGKDCGDELKGWRNVGSIAELSAHLVFQFWIALNFTRSLSPSSLSLLPPSSSLSLRVSYWGHKISKSTSVHCNKIYVVTV